MRQRGRPFGKATGEPWGACADHVGSVEMAREAFAAGCTMLVADLSGALHGEYAVRGRAEVKAAYGALPA